MQEDFREILRTREVDIGGVLRIGSAVENLNQELQAELAANFHQRRLLLDDVMTVGLAKRAAGLDERAGKASALLQTRNCSQSGRFAYGKVDFEASRGMVELDQELLA